MYYFLNILDFSILFEIKMHIPDLFHKFLYYFSPCAWRSLPHARVTTIVAVGSTHCTTGHGLMVETKPLQRRFSWVTISEEFAMKAKRRTITNMALNMAITTTTETFNF